MLLRLPDELLRIILNCLKDEPSSYFALATACRRTLWLSNWCTDHDDGIANLPMYQWEVCNSRIRSQFRFLTFRNRFYKTINFASCQLYVGELLPRSLPQTAQWQLEQITTLKFKDCHFSLDQLNILRDNMANIRHLEIELDNIQLPSFAMRMPPETVKKPTIIETLEILVRFERNLLNLMQYLKNSWHAKSLIISRVNRLSAASAGPKVMNYLLAASATIRHLIVYYNCWSFDTGLFRGMLFDERLAKLKLHNVEILLPPTNHYLQDYYIELMKQLCVQNCEDKFCLSGDSTAKYGCNICYPTIEKELW